MLRNKWEKLKCSSNAEKMPERFACAHLRVCNLSTNLCSLISFKETRLAMRKSDNRRARRCESYPFFTDASLGSTTQTRDKETHLLLVLSIVFALHFFKGKKEEKEKEKIRRFACHEVTYMYDVTSIKKKKKKNVFNTVPDRNVAPLLLRKQTRHIHRDEYTSVVYAQAIPDEWRVMFTTNEQISSCWHAGHARGRVPHI